MVCIPLSVMSSRAASTKKDFALDYTAPYFELFPSRVQSQYHEMQMAFSKLAKHVHICYSIKTNPHPKILEALASRGCGMESVSLRELNASKSFSTPKLFNSCASTKEELEIALKQNALIIIDSLSQAKLLSSLIKKPLNVGMRVRFDLFRFGFAADEVPLAIEEMEKMNLRVILLHSHPGTNQSLSDYEKFISKFAALVKEFPSMEAIDIGGGFLGKELLRQKNISISDYAKLIQKHLGAFLKDKILYVEAGRYLVEDSMELIAQIQHIKMMGPRAFAMMDAGINVLSKFTNSHYQYSAITQSGETNRQFRLCGPSMFASDEFGQLTGKLKEGDIIRIHNTGAYCTELAWNLSKDVPKIKVVET